MAQKYALTQLYKIMRYFAKEGKHPKLIKTDLTLDEARQWCSREDTHKTDVWFDGFTKQ